MTVYLWLFCVLGTRPRASLPTCAGEPFPGNIWKSCACESCALFWLHEKQSSVLHPQYAMYAGRIHWECWRMRRKDFGPWWMHIDLACFGPIWWRVRLFGFRLCYVHLGILQHFVLLEHCSACTCYRRYCWYVQLRTWASHWPFFDVCIIMIIRNSFSIGILSF